MPDASADPAAEPVIAVVGLTASGKSKWALSLARQLDGEVVSIDSRQIYRRLDIGTAKPTPQMRDAVPHWCLDIVDPTERYSLGQYLQLARDAIRDIRARGRRPVLVGGSGQHMRALLEGWVPPPVAEDSALRSCLEQESAAALHERLHSVDPDAARRIGPSNQRRLIRAIEVHELTGTRISRWQQRREPLDARVVAPDVPLDTLDQCIADRTAAMFRVGLVDEVHQLLDDGVPPDAPGFNAIGYREVLAHLRGDTDLAEAEAAVVHATRRFARRQQAWFRRSDPDICWSEAIPAAITDHA